MRRRGQSGFTLLEIIVALAVFGFLLVGLSRTVRFGLTAWRQDARLSAGQTDLEAVDRSLRSIIENLDPGDGSGPPIAGTADSLSGRTRLRVPGSGLQPVVIEAGLAVSGHRLVLRWRPYHHGQAFGPPPPPQEVDLVDGGVARLGIEYWRPSGVWMAAWHEPALPPLIRLRIMFAGDNPPRWPDIVAAPVLARP